MVTVPFPTRIFRSWAIAESMPSLKVNTWHSKSLGLNVGIAIVYQVSG